jgi:hypothetical protein
VHEPVALEENPAAGAQALPADRTDCLAPPDLVDQLQRARLSGLGPVHLAAGPLLLLSRLELGPPEQAQYVDGPAGDPCRGPG